MAACRSLAQLKLLEGAHVLGLFTRGWDSLALYHPRCWREESPVFNTKRLNFWIRNSSHHLFCVYVLVTLWPLPRLSARLAVAMSCSTVSDTREQNLDPALQEGSNSASKRPRWYCTTTIFFYQIILVSRAPHYWRFPDDVVSVWAFSRHGIWPHVYKQEKLEHFWRKCWKYILATKRVPFLHPSLFAKLEELSNLEKELASQPWCRWNGVWDLKPPTRHAGSNRYVQWMWYLLSQTLFSTKHIVFIFDTMDPKISWPTSRIVSRCY